MFDTICTHCGNPVTAPDHYHGKLIKCSICRSEFSASPKESQEFEFFCENCSNSITAPVTMAGTAVAPCPHCHMEIQIPRIGLNPKVPEPANLPAVESGPDKIVAPPRWAMPVGIAIVALILSIVGISIYNQRRIENRKMALEQEAKLNMVSLLRDANQISVATKRGVIKSTFIDSFERFRYDWDHNQSISKSDRFDDAIAAVGKAIGAWDCAASLWQAKGLPIEKQRFPQLMSKMEVAFGSEFVTKIFESAKATMNNPFSDQNIDVFISSCFTTASTALAEAEYAMMKARD